jgi:mannosyl-3-phosphoglycerate phosphatase
MQIIFSDLDRMLIDPDTCLWETAIPVFDRIREKRIPFVVVTNKTRAEVEVWRKATNVRYPFIVEGGGAIFFPTGYLNVPFRTRNNGEYNVLDFGSPYQELIVDLHRASEMAGCLVRGFHQMEVAELSQDAGLSPLQAELAKRREYSEAFRIVDGDPERLNSAVHQVGRRLTWRDQYFHITGNNHVTGAVRVLAQAFTLSFGRVTTIGVGTGADDTPFLKLMDRAVLASQTTWSEAALTILRE